MSLVVGWAASELDSAFALCSFVVESSVSNVVLIGWEVESTLGSAFSSTTLRLEGIAAFSVVLLATPVLDVFCGEPEPPDCLRQWSDIPRPRWDSALLDFRDFIGDPSEIMGRFSDSVNDARLWCPPVFLAS